MNIDRLIVAQGRAASDYPVEELERERRAVRNYRARLARAARRIHGAVLRGSPRLRQRRIRMLHHIIDACATPQHMSVAMMMPDRAGITDPREKAMLLRTFTAMQRFTA